ncbi:prenyltransferase [Demetria terragena]|uniref:prenyltransferase n=1 Tax=Demetria terragena TaxID=63959 RepID=UPI0006864E44|nr:prenyltransferase [Demetria terragena]
MLRRTGGFILGQQEESGAVPWFTGGQLDPWDHVEAAMGLASLGHHDAALAAYRWSARTQSADGSWPMLVRGGQVEDAASDTNQCAYIATGVWHFFMVTRRVQVMREMWPTVDRAIEFVVDQQQPGGEIIWAVSSDRRPDTFALRTGSASILHALECALEIGRVLGYARPSWQDAADRLRVALVTRPENFAERARFSMDWYYPVLAGALRESAGVAALQRDWERFVLPGRGARCVDDRPWVTVAESSELVLALDAVGRTDEAWAILRDIQYMRDPDTGGYWTGHVVDDDAFWPVEQTTWTAAAVVLAYDALTNSTGGAGIFRDLSQVQETADVAT